jgi:hypothetical protein
MVEYATNWHKYPEEKPSEWGFYLVILDLEEPRWERAEWSECGEEYGWIHWHGLVKAWAIVELPKQE